jgi:hypothetical protein
MSHDPSRRRLLSGLTAGVLPPTGPTACRVTPVPNVVVATHEGQRALFHDDLLRGKTALIHFVSLSREHEYPVLDAVARVQATLGERLGRDVHICSVFTDGTRDQLADTARRLGVKPGWWLLTGEPSALAALKSHFFQHAHAAGTDMTQDCSRGVMRYGNAAAGLWGTVPAKAEPDWIVERLSWVAVQARPAGPARRRGPAVLAAPMLALLVALLPASSRAKEYVGHPYPQPYLAASTQTTVGDTTTVVTGASLFEPSYPFTDPPGTNLLPTIYTNSYDSLGNEMPNTLPSTPIAPYNLHDGDPVVTTIERTSPTTDLADAFERIDAVARNDRRGADDTEAARRAIGRVIDILEGNPVEDRVYSGFPLLHYTGPLKAKKVQPITDAAGKVIGGTVDIHQIWYDNHIESDTAFLDTRAVQDVPWTVTWTLDVLDRGRDDFSPFAFYDDAPAGPNPGDFGKPNVGMDQTFFPMEEGTRTVLKLKMAPAKYWSLTYTWGWRWHPPRVQVTENLLKVVDGKNLLQWEQDVFGANPRENEEAKLAAIGKIGDLAPPKIMWQAMRDAKQAAGKGDWKRVADDIREARLSFDDWKDRTRLPRHVPIDKTADLTLFYANNTIHGHFTDGGTINYTKFVTRGTPLKVSLYNGDYFEHRYVNVDFGGGRGWENQFKSSVRVGGSGCWFTFGRAYININVPDPVVVPPATKRGDGQPDATGFHRVNLTFNFDPSRRLRFYQFDPTHHDVAIFSIH